MATTALPTTGTARTRLAQLAAHIDDPHTCDESPAKPIANTTTTNTADTSPRSSPARAPAPSLILLFGWTGCPRKALVRFETHYASLYPSAAIHVFLCTFLDFQPWPVRTASQRRRDLDAFRGAVSSLAPSDTILVHTFSGGGVLRFTELAELYRQDTGHRVPGVRLIVFDSTPTRMHIFRGSRTMNDQVVFPGSGPWMHALTRPFMALWLVLAWVWLVATFQREGSHFFYAAVLDPRVVDPRAIRGYVYSVRDETVAFEDIEGHIALSREKGLVVAAERYEESGHVGHARADPTRYWGFVTRLWEESARRGDGVF